MTPLDYSGVTPIVFDVETCGLPNAEFFLEPVQPAKNLVDPVKVSADIEKRTAERNERVALDWNVGRIVAIGWWTEESGLIAHVCPTEADETAAIEAFWLTARHRTLVGYNIKGFDLRFLVQRSRYLGIAYPWLNFSKYDRKGVADLYLDLTFGDGTYDQGAMRRTLHAFARRFGIAVEDEVHGKDIPALVEAGQWDDVRNHLMSDVALTLALARKLGVILSQREEAVV